MKRAFSLIEVLVALAIIGIIAAIVMNTVKGIQNSAVAVAQQKDQAELNQVLAELRMSGGNLAAIINPSTTPTAVTTSNINTLATQAGALTYLLQNPVTANSMTQKGTMGGQALSVNEVIIPYPYIRTQNDNRNRIAFNAGVPSIRTTGMGFIVVNRDSSPDWQAFNALSAVSNYWGQGNSVAYAGPAATSNLTGSKYASSQAYLWDEDTTAVTGPSATPTNGIPQTYTVNFTTAYSDGGTWTTTNTTAAGVSTVTGGPTATGDGGSTGQFNLAEYRGYETSLVVKYADGSYDTTYYDPPGATPGSPAGTPATVYIFAYLTDANGNVVTTNSSSSLVQEAKAINLSSNVVADGIMNTAVTPAVPATAGSVTSPSNGTLASLASGDIRTQLEANSNGITEANAQNVIGSLISFVPCSTYIAAADTYANAPGVSPTQFTGSSVSLLVSTSDNSTGTSVAVGAASLTLPTVILQDPDFSDGLPHTLTINGGNNYDDAFDISLPSGDNNNFTIIQNGGGTATVNYSGAGGD